ncbi:MAG: FAD-binding oxidoreductase [Actinomycetota bacterium]
MEATRIDDAMVGELAGSFSGELLVPESRGYDAARHIYNGLIDKHPGLIARCTSVRDVAAAIDFARAHRLEVSVRGGGHGVAGRAVTEGGVMIDLAPMKRIDVDPEARTVRAQGGVTWGELDAATAVHGLATTGGVISTTGIGGLTLGGGFGYLMGSYGMAADNLVSVELVTADGAIVNASTNEQADLFWALRGAGANFGVAASLTYRLHPVTEIVGGVIAHPFEAARDFLRFYRDFSDDVDDELYTFAGLGHAPDGSGVPIAVAVVGHSGGEEAANAQLKPLLEFGSPLIAQVGPMPYPAINTMFDEGYPKGSLNYWKSSFLREFDDEAIEHMIETFAACPSPMTGAVVEHFHGAATRVGATETAVPHREAGFDYLLTSVWMDPAVSDRNVTWTREAYSAMEPQMLDRRYVNYLSEDDDGASGPSVYGVNHDRLAEIKARYDPENVFHLNQNIRPKAPPG